MERVLRTIICICLFLPAFSLNAQDLGLFPHDLRIEMRADGGYHLFIRYKPDISSVLLTETTRDPMFRADNYAYRAAEMNPVNGHEIRLLDGYPIPKEAQLYSLISSSPEWHGELGWAYHIYIPDTLYYGYEGGRNGTVRVGNGTYLNIRTFYYAYADYRGAFMDNPFMLRIAQASPPLRERPVFLPETITAFTGIAGDNVVRSGDASDMVNQIGGILQKELDNKLDFVLCIDTTNSMKPYMDALKQGLCGMIQDISGGAESFRIGLVLFKDYYEEYLNKVIPFTRDFNTLQNSLDAIKAGGGGDIPEAVYEALYSGATQIEWAAESKKVMILIGDAPPHPRPRGKISKQMAINELAKRNIKIYAIAVPSNE